MMKSFTKMCLSLLLCLVLIAGLLPAAARATDSITIAEFNARLEAYVKDHPSGSVYKASGDGGSQCFGFANQIAKSIFGSYPTSSGSAISGVSKHWKITYGAAGVEAIHVGDVVRYSLGNYDHSIFITSIDGDEVTFSDANSDWANGIRHGKTMTIKDLTKKIKKPLAGNPDKTGWAAHYNGWVDCDWDHSAGGRHDGELTYKTVQKANGEYVAVCRNCGQEFAFPKLDKSCVGLYVFKAPDSKDGNANGIAGAPYAPACTRYAAKGEEIGIIGSVTNAYGNKWYKTTGNEYVYSKYLTYVGELPLPEAPTKLKAVWKDNSDGSCTAKISWKESAYATSYEVEYRRSGIDWKTDKDYGKNSATSYVSTGLKNYASYDYRVRAVNPSGVSKWVTLTIKKTVTVSFDANGGNVKSTTMKFTYKDGKLAKVMEKLPTPTWEGHKFVGWFTSKTGGTQITAGSTINFTKDTTLYAHWE